MVTDADGAGEPGAILTIVAMARTYKLDHFAKGTGASVVPIDERPDGPGDRQGLKTVRLRPEPRRPKRRGETRTTALPPGHVREKSTGEIGRVRSVDRRAGTASVLWLRQGRTSVVPLTALSRR